MAIKLSDGAVLKLLEKSMEDMVRFEVNESATWSQVKMYEFKEYLFEYLLTQYGLRNIAQKNFEYILQRVAEFADVNNHYALLMLNSLGQPSPGGS